MFNCIRAAISTMIPDFWNYISVTKFSGVPRWCGFMLIVMRLQTVIRYYIQLNLRKKIHILRLLPAPERCKTRVSAFPDEGLLYCWRKTDRHRKSVAGKGMTESSVDTMKHSGLLKEYIHRHRNMHFQALMYLKKK